MTDNSQLKQRHQAIDAALALPADYRFDAASVISAQDVAQLALTRATAPGEIDLALSERQRRPILAPRGKLVILAADHPARMVTAVGANPVAMANRADYLAQIGRASCRGRV